MKGARMHEVKWLWGVSLLIACSGSNGGPDAGMAGKSAGGASSSAGNSGAGKGGAPASGGSGVAGKQVGTSGGAQVTGGQIGLTGGQIGLTGGAAGALAKGGAGGVSVGLGGQAGATGKGGAGVGVGGSAGKGVSGGAGGAATVGGASSVWRPFNDASPWNTPIGDNPPLQADSTALIADFKSSSAFGTQLDVNIPQYSIPLFYATASTPTVDMLCDLGGEGFIGNAGSNAHAMVPMPSGAAPDAQSDHHLLIVDKERGIEWGMWNTRLDGSNWRCGLGATADLKGTGVRAFKPNNPTWYTSHGARACGFPLVAGLIRTDEIEAGRIDHALVVAYPHIRSGFYTSPATTAQVGIGTDAIPTRGIPCGGRIQFDPSINLDTLGLSRSGRIIVEALQRYGAYVGDYSGSINLYAENSPQARTLWANGVLQVSELSGKIDLASFRVLRFGTLTDDGNGNP